MAAALLRLVLAMVVLRWCQCSSTCPIRTDEVTTFAGNLPGPSDGVGTGANLRWPMGIAVTAHGTSALVADSSENKIRMVDLRTAAVRTLAGGAWGSMDGLGTAALFRNPAGVAITQDGIYVVVADQDNNKLRLIELATGAVTTLAGSGTEGWPLRTSIIQEALQRRPTGPRWW